MIATAADGGDATFEKAYNGLQGWVDCFPKAKLCGLFMGFSTGKAGNGNLAGHIRSSSFDRPINIDAEGNIDFPVGKISIYQNDICFAIDMCMALDMRCGARQCLPRQIKNFRGRAGSLPCKGCALWNLHQKAGGIAPGIFQIKQGKISNNCCNL